MEGREGESEERLVRGRVVRVTFSNLSNGYHIIKVQSDTDSLPLTVVGFSSSPLKEGIEVVAKGIFAIHPKYGKQLNATKISITVPTSKEGIERYLASGAIKGIGHKTAEKIVQNFGENSIEYISLYPEKVAKVPGVGEHKALMLQTHFKNQSERNKIIQVLVEKGISSKLAHRIFEKFQDKTLDILNNDPYLLARQLKGIGFYTADKIALSFGFEFNSPQRIKAGLHWALEKAKDEGHCYLSVNSAVLYTEKLLGFNCSQEAEQSIVELIDEGILIKDGDKLYLYYLFKAEKEVAQQVAKRAGKKVQDINLKDFKRALFQAESSLNIKLSQEQKESVKRALSCKFLVITGGPGCGKTTLVKALTEVFSYFKKNIALTAPTGRAAQRMSALSGHTSHTIHRLLKYDPFRGQFLYNADSKLMVDGKYVDVIIIDESSMIDIQLASALLEAIPLKSTVIFIGDKDQLPPVGPGNFFADIVHNSKVPTIYLTKVYRRESHSIINSIAHNINSGMEVSIPIPDGEIKSDAYFIPRKTPEGIIKTVKSLLGGQIQDKFGINLDNTMVLTPTNRGILGTINLNRELQTAINKRQGGVVKIGDMVLKTGDKVCQTVNNYNIDPGGVFNGDIGYIHSINSEDKEVVVKLWDDRIITYKKEQIRQLSLAYVLTVHRSQGAEADCVIVILHPSQYILLKRQLLYTAVTRAKKLLIIIGSKKALQIAINNTTADKRLSNLNELIYSFVNT